MSTKWFFLTIIFFLYGVIYVQSQTGDIIFKNITINDGLSQNSVVDIVQDNQGFMWFATQDGLNRYDGNVFKIFPISFDDITNPDNSKLGKLLVYNNSLWMITKGGRLEVMDLASESFTSIYNFPQSGAAIPSVSYIYIENKDRIWLGTENAGLYLLNGNLEIIRLYSENSSADQRILSNKINKIFKDSTGRIWVLTKGGINVLYQNRITSHLEGVNSNTLIEDSKGRLWMGSLGQGIFLKDNITSPFHHLEAIHNDRSVPSDLTVESLFMDENYRLWIGTYGRGLYILDNESNLVNHIMPDSKNPRSLGFQDILSIFQDKNKGIWIGTDGGGMSFYDESFKNFRILTSHNAPDDIAVEQIRAITTDPEGFIWFGTSGNGFSRYDPIQHKFKPFHLKPYKKGITNYDRIVVLHADGKGDLWVGTHGNGTLVINRKNGEIRKWFTNEALRKDEKIPDNNLWCFLEEGENRIWAGSRYSGLLLLDKNEGLIRQYVQDDMEDDNIRAIARVNDSILALGYEKKGLHLFHIKTGIFESIATDFIKTNLDKVEIKSLYYHKNLLWAGTSGKGLLVTDLITGDTRIFTDKDGLPNNMIYGIVPENDYMLWGSTNRGLFRLRYELDDNIALPVNIDLFTQENGLQSNEFNTGAYHKCENGRIYFGGIKGLNYFNPDELIIRKNKVKVVISEALIENMPYRGDKIINYTEQINLPYDKNSIAFTYAALDYNSQEILNYSYQLQGYDEDWVHAGTRNYTAYTNLTPGNYIFKVRLTNSFEGESPITSLGIFIATPFWQTIWFKILFVLLCIGVLYVINQNYIQQLLALQKVKDTISADLHDDLGSRLTTIHLLSAISQPGFQKHPKLIQVLKKIEKEIQASSEALDEIVWNIKIHDESLIEMIANIRRHISEVLEDCNIRYTISTPDELGPSYRMKMQKRRDLYLICKELITNVRKHADAKHVEITIGREKNMLYVSVKDDGKGFCPKAKTHRNGLSNLRRRIAKWSGSLNISSKASEGSLFEVRIPFDGTNYFRNVLNKFF